MSKTKTPITSAPVFDLGNYDLSKANEEGVWLPVLHPVTREPIQGMRRKIVGHDSKIYKQAQRDLVKKSIAEKKTNKTLKAEEYDAYADAQIENDVYILSRCLVDWEGHVLDGTPLPCDQGTKEMILDSEHWGWYRDDLNTDVFDRKNFFPNA